MAINPNLKKSELVYYISSFQGSAYSMTPHVCVTYTVFLCWQDGHDGDSSKQSTADMTAFVSILSVSFIMC